MDEEKHKELHRKLHVSLDKLIADFCLHTGKFLSHSTVLELMEWSHKQTTNPTE